MLFFDVVDHFEAFHSVSNKFGPVGAVLGHLEPFWTTPFGTIVAHSVPFFLRISPNACFWNLRNSKIVSYNPFLHVEFQFLLLVNTSTLELPRLPQQVPPQPARLLPQRQVAVGSGQAPIHTSLGSLAQGVLHHKVIH